MLNKYTVIFNLLRCIIINNNTITWIKILKSIIITFMDALNMKRELA